MHVEWKIVVVFHRVNSFIFQNEYHDVSVSMCTMLMEGHGDFAA